MILAFQRPTSLARRFATSRPMGLRRLQHSELDDTPIQYLEGIDRNHEPFRIAYRYLAPAETSGESGTVTIVFLNGLLSAMSGAKSRSLQQHAAANGVGCLRFDYRGHGNSSGDFVDCTMHDWMEDAETMLDVANPPNAKEEAKVVLVGSSLGAWIAVNLALKRPGSIAGIVGIGSAFDFTRHTFDNLTTEEKAVLSQREDGANPAVDISSPYLDDPYPFSQALWESGKSYLLSSRRASKEISLSCPVRLLHGSEDKVIHSSLVMEAAEALRTKHHCNDITLKVVEGGDHRLSRPEDIELLLDTVGSILK
ncbi:hypothetical protein ACHAXT_007810 [Thalassiosira profunda]